VTRVRARRHLCPLVGGLLFVLTGLPYAHAVDDQSFPRLTGGYAASDSRMSLASLIAELEATNPGIRAARQRREAAKAVVPQVQTLPDPKLRLGYQRMPMVPPLMSGSKVSGRKDRRD
jgi:hypothetical protein